MKHFFLPVFASALALTAMADEKVTVATDGGQTVTLQCYGSGIVRVIKTPKGKAADGKQSLAVTAKPVDGFKVKTTATAVTARTGQVIATVNKADGTVTFTTARGARIVAEGGTAQFPAFNDAGRNTYQPSQLFALAPDEAIYGLGILQNGKMSQRGENRLLRPGNTEDGIPFFMSQNGYGVFWDNYSATTISDGEQGVTLKAAVGDEVDYYMIYGGNADGVVAGVRSLSGSVPMSPLWSYGFHQCRERYKSQDELLEVLRRYRKDGVPFDCMIQDWQYWGGNNLWNAMDFLAESFSNPKAMIDEVHEKNAHIMISIWQSFGPNTLQYRELDKKGLLLDMATWPQSVISHVWPPRMEYPSGVRVIDTYSPEARDIYWKHLTRLYDMGLDGWWMDSTEPDHHDWKPEDWTHQTGLGSYQSVEAAFPLLAVGGVYDHQLAYDKRRDERGFILTRSAFFGQQRTGANTWSGDVVSTWDMLRRQVPAGLNFSLTGNPNYNSDLGGFFAGSYNWSWKGKPAYENPAYRELYLRWMQFGVFTPMMRSHGADTPRELYYYGQAGEPIYDGMLAAIKLRYALLPYIYSTAWQVSHNNGTFMRALVMDFPKDRKAMESASEYMFGSQLLATPVLHSEYTPEVTRRDKDANAGWDKNTGRVSFDNLDKAEFAANRDQTFYLPQGTSWYYFHSGRKYDGGQEVTLSTPIVEAPFFVRAGSILPIGPDVQYSNEKPWDNLELRVYAGANGQFTLYEDAGDGFGYQKGEYTEIPMSWSDGGRTLTIGARSGGYDGMLSNRTFRVSLVKEGTPTYHTVQYTGKAVKVKL